ncbi:MAG: hypothetical protein ABII06_09495 [Pseudomonadota bacterium]
MKRALPMVFLERMKHAPFPYEGEFVDTGEAFFDYVDSETGKRYHTNRHGDRFEEDRHYRDSTVLFCIPPAFEPEEPFFYLVFFHGHGTTAAQSVTDYELIEQVVESKKNVVFIAPQLAVEASDSSPGKFYQEGNFGLFMDEVARILSEKIGREHAGKFRIAPIVLASFSGGYKSVAYILDRGGVSKRLRGVFLLDALYEDLDKFQSWILKYIRETFFLLIYTEGSVEQNAKALAEFLDKNGIRLGRRWPAPSWKRGVFLIKSDADHFMVPLIGPPSRPLKQVLEGLRF